MVGSKTNQIFMGRGICERVDDSLGITKCLVWIVFLLFILVSLFHDRVAIHDCANFSTIQILPKLARITFKVILNVRTLVFFIMVEWTFGFEFSNKTYRNPFHYFSHRGSPFGFLHGLNKSFADKAKEHQVARWPARCQAIAA